jgi:two-component system chemotaxis response regulator CheY
MYALIIDDSRAMRRILRTVVEPLGFRILEAGDGREGLDRLEEHYPDVELTLVDWNMPVMNGLEFVKTVRADKQYQQMKIAMVTTETEPAQMTRALMAGVDEYVMKPFTSEILVEKLRLMGCSVQTSFDQSMTCQVQPDFSQRV